MIFQQGPLPYHFALATTNYVAEPATAAAAKSLQSDHIANRLITEGTKILFIYPIKQKCFYSD